MLKGGLVLIWELDMNLGPTLLNITNLKISCCHTYEPSSIGPVPTSLAMVLFSTSFPTNWLKKARADELLSPTTITTTSTVYL